MYCRSKPLSAASLVFFVVHIHMFQLHQHLCNAEVPGAEDAHCPPFSCGKIHNIKFPFRLKGQPRECGDSRYQLDCENNITTIIWMSGKYSVQAINHEDFTIRLVDVGVLSTPNLDEQQEGCQFPFPRYFLSKANLTYLNQWINSNDRFTYLRATNPRASIIYFNCPGSVDDGRYVYIGPCKDAHMYAVLGTLTAEELKSECRVTTVSLVAATDNSTKASTMADIRNLQASGFELSWSLGLRVCGHVCFTGRCMINIDGNVTCARIYRRWFPYILHFIAAICAMFTLTKLVLGGPFIIIFCIYKWRRRHLSMYLTIENFLQSNTDMMPIRYSSSEIKKMTKGFKDKLGEGGFGSVFRGELRSGRAAAVKMLKDSTALGQDFVSEVSTIGRIHHVNVVQLVGYCIEGSKRALVYDFMHNGSLDRHIFPRGEANSQFLSWEKLFDISIGVARGIAYLHDGCDIRILHFDIKPHNILLDENFTPKISDFGLARLYPVDDSIITLTAARGTIGYMAPELFYKNIGGVSHKADVYSFGMMLLDVCGKRTWNSKPNGDDSSEIYFPSWIHNQVSSGKEIEVADASGEERQLVRKMVIVALWCIQMKPSDRPSMKRVAEMLEDEPEDCIKIPPKPFMCTGELQVQDAGDDTNSTWSSANPSHDEYSSHSNQI